MKLPARHILKSSDDDRRGTLDRHAAIIGRRLGGTTWPGDAMDGFVTMALADAALHASIDPQDPRIVDDLELCACAAAATFKAALTPGSDPLEVAGPGARLVQLDRSKFDRKHVSAPLHWRSGLLAALAARRNDVARYLASLGVDELRPLSPQVAPWFFSEAAALSAVVQRERGAGDKLVAAMEEADPEKASKLSRNFVLDIVVPELELAFRAIDNDAAGVARVLQQAIEGHHHYYGTGDAKGLEEGALALAPLAMACLARDLGVTIPADFVTDYAPRWIIDRTGGSAA